LRLETERGIISNGVKKEGIYLIKKLFSSLAARLKGPRKMVGHIIPSIEKWKRRVLREKDLTDFVGHDL